MAKLVLHIPDEKIDFATRLATILGWEVALDDKNPSIMPYQENEQISITEEEAIKLTEWVAIEASFTELSLIEKQILDDRLNEDRNSDISSDESLRRLKDKYGV